MSIHNSPAEDWTENPMLEESFAQYWARINPMPDASSTKEARGRLENAMDQLEGLRDESDNPHGQVLLDDDEDFPHWQAISEAFALDSGDAVSHVTPTSPFDESTEVNVPARFVKFELDPHPDNDATVAGQQDEDSHSFDPIPDPGAPNFRLSFSDFSEGDFSDVLAARSAHDQVDVSLPDGHSREITAEDPNRAHNGTSPYDSAASESNRDLSDRPTSPSGERELLDLFLAQLVNPFTRPDFRAAQASVEQTRTLVTGAVNQSRDSHASPDCLLGEGISVVDFAYRSKPRGLAASGTFPPEVEVEVAALTGNDDDPALDKISQSCPSGQPKRGTKRIAGPLDKLGETGNEYEEARSHKKRNLGPAF